LESGFADNTSSALVGDMSPAFFFKKKGGQPFKKLNKNKNKLKLVSASRLFFASFFLRLNINLSGKNIEHD